MFTADDQAPCPCAGFVPVDLRTKLVAVLRDLHNAAVDEERDYPMRANAIWDAIERIQRATGIEELWPDRVDEAHCG